MLEGSPYYSVTYHGIVIIAPSALGFRLLSAEPLLSGLEIEESGRQSFDETWEPVYGERSEIRNHYEELAVSLREIEAPHRKMKIVFRVFDDGVGFRYELPAQENLRSFAIVSEETRFNFTGNHTVWCIPLDYNSYERVYTESPLEKVRAVNTPVTMKTTDGIYISIHEADLTDYAGMTLIAQQGTPWAFKANLVPWPDGVKVKGRTPARTPWRTITLAEWPGGLAKSDLILNLNRPNKIEDTSWIRPMKYIGIWWGMHIKKYSWGMDGNHGATTENAKRHIDFASENGIPGLLIEGWNTGWEFWGQKDAYSFIEPYPDFDLEEVARYASEKGVALIGHHETGGDVPGYMAQIDTAFALYRRLGIHAVKTGYAGGIFPRGQHHHGQWMVNHYRTVVRKAARYQLMIDAHEPIKPTGIRRTWPNMTTREGVRGMEYNAWSSGNPPSHTTIIPFTRMLAGPADYTPGIFDLTFDEYQKNFRVRTTLAKQLALYVVLYSPLQMAADLPENYEGHPAFEFIREVPVDWDETRILDAEIGDFVITARRAADSWYIGAVTDENARVFLTELSFLEPGRRYLARIYADAPDADWNGAPTLIDISESKVGSESVLTLRLVPGGGQAISITPLD